MNFYVYENWTHKKAVVHRSTCGYCNDGRGIQAADSGRNGKWHGPIGDKATAFAFANSLRQPDTKVCGSCGA
jgi:F-type H+-transporting ATPase subunit beta